MAVTDAAVQLLQTGHSPRLRNRACGELVVCGTKHHFAAAAPTAALKYSVRSHRVILPFSSVSA